MPDLDAGLFAVQDSSVQKASFPTNSSQESLPASDTLWISSAAGNSATAGSNPSATSNQSDPSQASAPALTSNLLALNGASPRPSISPVLAGQSASGSMSAPMGAGAGAVMAPPSASNPLPSAPVRTPQQSSAGPVARAASVPAAALHHMTASVVAPGNPNGPGNVHPDASVNWTTYVTGSGNDSGNGVAVDSSGNVYTTGYTDDGTTRSAFVAEYDNTGKQLAFTSFQVQDPFVTYVQSEGHGIAVDGSGGVYVTGKATDIVAGDTDAFIMKFQLDPNNPGQFAPVAGYGGGIGGQFSDSGEAITVDSQGNATMTGTYQPTATETDIFAAKYLADGSDIYFANYYQFGGADGSAGNAIALDSTGSTAYLAGSMHVAGGDNDILVLKIDNGTGLSPTGHKPFFTMSNPGNDTLTGIAVDQNGQAYIAGTLASSSGTNGFVGEVSADGKSLVNQYAIPNTQTGNGLALDTTNGKVYVVATTTADSSNNTHAFVQKLDTSLTPGDSATIGGSGNDTGLRIAYDPGSGAVYVAGMTSSSDLSTDGTMIMGTNNAFLSSVGSFS
ncbi:MAG TPA: SBBP repeat-containing protein [Gemmataceae bacterium]|nr:SBBP repeat-containing protein [Gemmataceae bacterium]